MNISKNTIKEEDEDDCEVNRMRKSAPSHTKDESNADDYELNRMKSAPTNMNEEELELTRVQSQHTDTKKENEPTDHNVVRSAPVDIQEDGDDNDYAFERMQSAPSDIFMSN